VLERKKSRHQGRQLERIRRDQIKKLGERKYGKKGKKDGRRNETESIIYIHVIIQTNRKTIIVIN
jgi:hypothetical protein